MGEGRRRGGARDEGITSDTTRFFATVSYHPRQRTVKMARSGEDILLVSTRPIWSTTLSGIQSISRPISKLTLKDHYYIILANLNSSLRERPNIRGLTNSRTALIRAHEYAIQEGGIPKRETALNGEVDCCLGASGVEVASEDQVTTIEPGPEN